MDAITIERARRQDRAAQAQLLRQLQDPWYRLCRSLLRDDELARMAAMVPLLTCYQPPERAEGILLDRFSPNFTRSGEHGFAEVRPFPAYDLVYPLPEPARRGLAFYFTWRYSDGRDVAALNVHGVHFGR